jgi:hypothetical protein
MSEILVNTIKKADGTGSITVPADSGTLLTSASDYLSSTSDITPTASPAFRAILGADQTGLTSNAFNKVNLDTVQWDTHSGWSTANKRYTFPVNGYYLISAHIKFAGSSRTRELVSFYKNGSEVWRSTDINGSSAQDIPIINGTTILYGTTSDYFELYGYPVGSSLVYKYTAAHETCALDISLLRTA